MATLNDYLGLAQNANDQSLGEFSPYLKRSGARTLSQMVTAAALPKDTVTPNPITAPDLQPFVAPEDTDSSVDAVLKTLKNIPLRAKQFYGGAVRAVGEEFGSFGRIAQSEAKTLKELFEEEGTIQPQNFLTEYGARVAGEALTELTEKAPNVRPGTLPFYVSAIIGSTVEMVPALAASMLTRNPNVGLSIIGTQVYASQYAVARAEGKNIQEAKAQSFVYAASEVLTEKIPLGILTKEGGAALTKILKAAGAEGLQEPINQAIQMAYDIGVSEDQTFADALEDPRVWAELRDAAIIGMGAGGALGGAVAGVERIASKPVDAPPPTRGTLPADEDAPMLKIEEPEFYSQLARAAEGLKQERGTPDQMLSMIKKTPGVKPAEIEAVDLEEYLNAKKEAGEQVTKAEIQEYVEANGVQVQTKVLGGPKTAPDYTGMDLDDALQAEATTLDESRTKYDAPEYQVPGGENYREVLLTLPGASREEIDRMVGEAIDKQAALRLEMADETDPARREELNNEIRRLGTTRVRAPDEYLGDHFDQPNVLLHLRVNDRTGPNGEKILFLEELQSDWAQTGRKEGYLTDIPAVGDEVTIPRMENAVTRLPDNPGQPTGNIFVEDEYGNHFYVALDEFMRGVPSQPFKGNAWVELGLKKALRMAAEEGYDAVSWTPGGVQADRYDLSKKISEIHYSGTNLKAYDLDGNTVIERTGVLTEELPDIIGKEATDRLLAQEPKGTLRSLTDEELQIGGEGMKSFYDRTMPNIMKKVARKLDKSAQLGEVEIATALQDEAGTEIPDQQTVQSITLTDEMRGGAMKGQALFKEEEKPIGEERRAGMPPADIQGLVDVISPAIPDLEIKVLPDVEALPPAERAFVGDTPISGMISSDRKSIYIIAQQTRNPRHVAEIIYHEKFGHWAIEKFHTDKELNQLLDDVIELSQTDKTVKRTAARVKALYEGRLPDDRTFAREIVAHMAEDRTKLQHTVLQRMWGIMRRLARKWLPDSIRPEFTISDLRAVLIDSSESIQKRPAREQAAAASIEDGDLFAKIEEAEREGAEEKGLPMDKESRLQRAREMGKDTDTLWYHGTDREFDAFSIEAISARDKFDQPVGGRNADAGFWFDTNQDFAKTYGDKVSAFYLPKDMKAVDWETEMRESLRKDADDLFPDGSIDIDALTFDELEEFSNPDGSALWDWMGEIIQEAKVAGDSGVIFKNVIDANARFSEKVFPSNQAVVFNPNQIRSINAAFDPEFQESPDLLAKIEGVGPEEVKELAESLRAEFDLEELYLYLKRGDLKLDYIIVSRDQRKTGVGSAVMERLTDYADQHGLRMTLSPALRDDAHGTTSRGRLVKFYKRFGFVENKGRNKDFTISEGMFREPSGDQALAKIEEGAEQPPGYDDKRIVRDDYRNALRLMADEIVPGGGAGAVMIERDEYSEERNFFRAPSLNPPWFQEMSASNEKTMEKGESLNLSVRETKNAVRKALAGERLGSKQQRVITYMMDVYSDQRSSPENIEARKKEWKDLSDFRRAIWGANRQMSDYNQYAEEISGRSDAENEMVQLFDDAAELGLSDETIDAIAAENPADPVAAAEAVSNALGGEDGRTVGGERGEAQTEGTGGRGAPPAAQAPSAAPNDFSKENAKIREEHKTLWTKSRTLLRRWFAPGGLLSAPLTEDAFKEQIFLNSQLEVVEFETRHILGKYDRAVRDVYGKKFRKLSDQDKEMLSDALSGDSLAITALPEPMQVVTMTMRQHIDGMSRQYTEILRGQALDLAGDGQNAAALAKADLLETILGNMGTYVHRSYQAFDDPKWFQKLSDEVINDARHYLARQYMAQAREEAPLLTEQVRSDAYASAERVLHELLKTDTAYDSLEGFVKGSKLGAKDLSILKRRKDIGPEIRALLGEYKDPRINYAKSVAKMGRLIWNQRFLDKVKSIGEGVFLFTEDTRPPDATAQIAADESEVMAPLNGMWTFPEVNQAFIDALGKEQMNNWYRNIVIANGIIKFGKTVGSPGTGARNWQSAAIFTLANGHFNWKHMAKSVAGMREYFFQTGSEENFQYLRHLKSLGVIYDTAYAGEMMALLKDTTIDERFLSGKEKTGIKAMINFAQKFYQYGDDFWKIIGFENEKRMLLDSGMNIEEAEKEAAERIRNTYPTYSMVGRAIKELRKFPFVGTFVSFSAEIVRTSYNILDYLQRDMKTPGRRSMALRRASGLMIASGFFYAIQELSKAMLGLDDDDEEAVRTLSPPWGKNSNFMFTDINEDGLLEYYDLSYVDPYNYWKRPITAILRDEPWEDIFLEVAREIISPFLGEDIAAGAIMEAYSNKRDTGGPIYDENWPLPKKFAAILNHLRKAAQPGLASNIENTFKAAQGRLTSYGKKYTLDSEVRAWFGWRKTPLDPKVALFYRVLDFNNAKRAASTAFNKVARDPNPVTEEEVKDAYLLALRIREKAYKDMSVLVSAVRKVGLSGIDLEDALRASSVSTEDRIYFTSGGPTPKWKPSSQSQSNAEKRAGLLLSEEAKIRINARYSYARDLADEAAVALPVIEDQKALP